jgi:hypothetical protein
MARYRCIRDCFYNNRLYTAGEVTELEKAPEHFVLLDNADKEPDKPATNPTPGKPAVKSPPGKK